MRSDALPLAPVPLTADEAEAMLQRQIKKHHVAIILLHWFNATTWILEVATGAALVSSRLFRVAPGWYLAIVNGLFGTRGNLLRFHVALGLAWIGVFLVYGIFGLRTYLRGEVLKKEIALDRDDMRWLIVRALRILGKSDEALPLQGVYNAGQKLFSMVVYAMLPVVMVTGVIMAFRLFSPWVVGWAVVLHFTAVGAVVAGLVIHVYMGAVFPEEKPAFFSMFTGSVNELFAYNHHFKWWREMKTKQLAWDRRREPAAEAAGPQTPAGSEGDAEEPSG
ncbi:MAG: cytochrome b/b6 domain-containing protein [Thermoanaerobaculia bacterium]